MQADNDEADDGDYLSAYLQMDIDDVVAKRVWSVEHVVPRSHINGRQPGLAEDDPNGWIVATRRSNSRRGNLPLVLWMTDPLIPNSIALISGEAHFVPPVEQRAELARKWLFLRATYEGIQQPSRAQRLHAMDIIELARHAPVQPAHWKVNAIYRRTYGWANPLLEEGAGRFYSSQEWRRSVFKSVSFKLH